MIGRASAAVQAPSGEADRDRGADSQNGICDGDDGAWWRGSGIIEPTTLEIATYAYDPEKLGIGTGPLPNSFFSSSILLPSAPTTQRQNRYMVLLAALGIPEYTRAVLRGIRTGGTIGSLVPGANGALIPNDFAIQTDTFSFMDGDVLFGITTVPGVVQDFPIVDQDQRPSTSTSLYDVEPSLKYVPPLFPYTAPAAGVFPGYPLQGYGAFSDWRFPEQGTVDDIAIPLEGPQTVYLWASVWQTDPSTRTQYDSGLLSVAQLLAPETGFLLADPNAIYRRIWGSMVFDISSTKRKFLERPIRFSVVEGGLRDTEYLYESARVGRIRT